ncbi:basic 7S globulin-like [Senna tora]|uniref:Basic 7S globulin-like n=1 Tax=Senna tora TaxID=362788 RepID=A0A834VZ34_9FABA|nr:basic 7S globulin-like [Senna tora]
MGLARIDLPFPIQLSLAYSLPCKFALCLPTSSNTKGNFLIGVRASQSVSDCFEEGQAYERKITKVGSVGSFVLRIAFIYVESLEATENAS